MNAGLATRAILFTDMVSSAEHRSLPGLAMKDVPLRDGDGGGRFAADGLPQLAA